MPGGGFFDSTNAVDELSVPSWPAGSWMPSPPNLILPNRQANQAGFYGAGQIWSVGGLVGQTFQFLAEVQRRSNGGGPCGTTYGNANGDAHIHSDSDSDGNCHIHSDGDSDSNCHIHSDGDSNSYAYTDSYTYGDSDIYRDGYSHSYSYGNCDHYAAAYTDAATSADTAASSLALLRIKGTREKKTREFPA